MEHHYLSRRVSMDTFNRNFYQSDVVMTPEEAQRTQKPYRYGMILLCFGALINWIGLAENYTDPFRYAGVACIIGGAFLICTAMCCWLHVPNRSAVGVSETDDNDAIHVISVGDQPTSEKPPEYDTVVVLEPPCYDDAIKLNPANLLQTKYYQDISLPNYNDLEISAAGGGSGCSSVGISDANSRNNSVVSNNDNAVSINIRDHNDYVANSQINSVVRMNDNGSSSSSDNDSQRNNNRSEDTTNNNSNTFTVITIDEEASSSPSYTSNECSSVTTKSCDCKDNLNNLASQSSALR